jgi:hypothetical protein
MDYKHWTNVISDVTNLASSVDDVTIVFNILELDGLRKGILNGRVI